MKWTVASGNIKIFGRAIHTLARFTDEVYLEFQDSGITVRAVNTSRYAYASFVFSPHFFAEFVQGPISGPVFCKISTKGLMLAFKTLTNLDKTIEKCSLDIIQGSDKFTIFLECKYDVIKSYSIPLLDSESLSSAIQADSYPITISAQPKLFSDGIQNFAMSIEEITLSVSEEKVTLKTYLENEPDPLQLVHTVVQFEVEEFEDFNLAAGETDITFCLKELRIFLHFAEVCNSNVVIQIDKPGKPALFSIKSQQGYELSFLIATLSENDSTDQLPVTNPKEQRPSNILGSSFLNESAQPTGSQRNFHKPNSTANENRQEMAQAEASQHERSRVLNQSSMQEMDAESSPVEEDSVPGTPPHKKFRRFFFGMSSTQETTILPQDDVVLVPASDEEDVS